MITKILAIIAVVLCGAASTFFTCCGLVAISQGSMENVAKSAVLVCVLTFAEILCIMELTRE